MLLRLNELKRKNDWEIILVTGFLKLCSVAIISSTFLSNNASEPIDHVRHRTFNVLNFCGNLLLWSGVLFFLRNLFSQVFGKSETGSNTNSTLNSFLSNKSGNSPSSSSSNNVREYLAGVYAYTIDNLFAIFLTSLKWAMFVKTIVDAGAIIAISSELFASLVFFSASRMTKGGKKHSSWLVSLVVCGLLFFTNIGFQVASKMEIFFLVGALLVNFVSIYFNECVAPFGRKTSYFTLLCAGLLINSLLMFQTFVTKSSHRHSPPPPALFEFVSPFHLFVCVSCTFLLPKMYEDFYGLDSQDSFALDAKFALKTNDLIQALLLIHFLFFVRFFGLYNNNNNNNNGKAGLSNGFVQFCSLQSFLVLARFCYKDQEKKSPYVVLPSSVHDGEDEYISNTDSNKEKNKRLPGALFRLFSIPKRKDGAAATSLFYEILSDDSSKKIFYFLCITISFMMVEVGMGMWTGSLGLISDAGHMFFDSAALFLGLFASYAAKWKADATYTYGYGRYEIIAGFINAVFLTFVAGFVFSESMERMSEPPELRTEGLLLTSVLGLVVNMIGLFFFHDLGGGSHSHGGGGSHSHSHGGDDENMRGVYLHVLADALGSVGVITSSLLIHFKGWYVADPICSFFISALIFLSVLPLLKSTANSLMLKTPKESSKQFDACLHQIKSQRGVLGIPQSHLWRCSKNLLVCSVHVCVHDGFPEPETLSATASHLLKQHVGVHDVTVQVCSKSLYSEMTNYNN